MRTMPDYIFDTTVLSNFAASEKPDLLAIRYARNAFTTTEVADELRRGVSAGYTYLEPALNWINMVGYRGWLKILIPESMDEHELRSQFDQILDPGEASCLALAISRGLTLVTDDLAARRLAQKKHVSLSGTLGILVALVRSGTVSLKEANAILRIMIKRHYRSPIDRLDEFV